jgi:hypothetical protein
LFVPGTNGLRRVGSFPDGPGQSRLSSSEHLGRGFPLVSRRRAGGPSRALDWDEAECRCDRTAPLYGPRRFNNGNRMRRTRLEQMLLTSLASCSAAAIERYTTRRVNRATVPTPRTLQLMRRNKLSPSHVATHRETQWAVYHIDNLLSSR